MQHFQNLKIGDEVDITPQRDIVGGRISPPVWNALRVPPCKEAAAVAMLKAKGVFAFYPSETRSYKARGKKIERHFPVVTQIVYARFNKEPQFDVMKARRLITGVFSLNGKIIVIPPDIIRQLQGLPTKAEAIRAARAELLRVREGDKARITEGPLSGFMVDIKEVVEGRAWFETITGIKGEAHLDKLERITEGKDDRPHV